MINGRSGECAAAGGSAGASISRLSGKVCDRKQSRATLIKQNVSRRSSDLLVDGV